MKTKARYSNPVRFLSVLGLAIEPSRAAAGLLRLRKTVNATALLAAMLLLTATTGRASVLAGPVFNPANGHVYYLLSENTWTASEAEAEALGGTLAIINDPAENAWIYSTFSMFGGDPHRLWIGLTDKDVEGTFVWVTGDPLVYSNWGGDEPNNNATGEDYAHIFGPDEDRAPGWNDAPDDWSICGVVETSSFAGSWVSFWPGSVWVWENEGQANVSVILLRGTNLTDLAISVDYTTVDSTAHAGDDYMATNGTLQFAVGETSKQVAIPILNDTLWESEEQFRIVLSNLTGGVSLGNSSVVIRIQSDDVTTLYVNIDNPNPVFPYTNWVTVATNIQHAVDAAHSGDTVLVTNGVYAVGSRGPNPEYPQNSLCRVVVTNAIGLESVNGPLVTTIEGWDTVVTNEFGEVVGWDRG